MRECFIFSGRRNFNIEKESYEGQFTPRLMKSQELTFYLQLNMLPLSFSFRLLKQSLMKDVYKMSLLLYRLNHFIIFLPFFFPTC